MKTRLISTLFLLLIVTSSVRSQTALDSLLKFVENINTFSAYVPQEKVYLQTDNNNYFLGETIWFKAYVVSSPLHKATNISKILYIELLTPEGQVVESKKCEINNGQCHGEILLSTRKFYSGFHELRAYTRYMTNFDNETVFSRVIPIYSYPENGSYDKRIIADSEITRNNLRDKLPKRDNLSIELFPEGGILVAGLSTRVAFRTTDKDGKSVTAQGRVHNSKGESIVEFSTQHKGMGSFYFCPELDESYTIEIASDNLRSKANFPKILASGYALTADNLKRDQIDVKLQKSSGQSSETLGLAVLIRGNVHYMSVIDFTELEMAIVNIPCAAFPSGVCQLVLFNKAGHILADRLVFNKNNETFLFIQPLVEKNNYAPFEKINLNFDVSDHLDNPVEISFSLSVRDRASDLESINDDNILTNLLLSSEVKGMIENPDFYFESNDLEHHLALDLLMLTQGWRGYKWENLTMQKTFELKQPVEKSLQIDGVIKSRFQEKPKTDMEVQLIMFQRDSTGYYGDDNVMGYTKTDSEGRFEFKLGGALYDSWESIIQAQKKEERRKFDRIMLNRFFSPTPTEISEISKEFRPSSFNAANGTARIVQLNEDTDSNKVLLENKSEDMSNWILLLDELEVTAKSPERKQEEKLSASLIEYDVRQSREDLIDKGYEVYDKVTDFLAATDPSFQVYPGNRGDSENNFYSDKGYYSYNSLPVMFMINNKPLIDQAWSSIDNISMGYIEKIIICKSANAQPRTIYNTRNEYDVGMIVDVKYLEGKRDRLPDSDLFNSDGKIRSDIVYIFLHTKPNYKSIKQSKDVRTIIFNGYALSREFFSPQYDYEMDYDINDHRRTLYWNPDVRSDAQGKANVSFYNNATESNLSIEAETITPDGGIGVLKK